MPLTDVTGAFLQPFSFSPDGTRLAFAQTNAQTKGDLWILPLEEAHSDHPKSGQAAPFLQTPFNDHWPVVSPDGRWVAYLSDEAGRDDVYVQPFLTGGGGKWRISTDGGSSPVWSKTSNELFYRTREGMMVAGYAASDSAFVPGKPRLWASKTDLSAWFDLSADGKRFVILENDPAGSRSTHVTFLLNFFDELRRRASEAAR
jgi:hypothetical protein